MKLNVMVAALAIAGAFSGSVAYAKHPHPTFGLADDTTMQQGPAADSNGAMSPDATVNPPQNTNPAPAGTQSPDASAPDASPDSTGGDEMDQPKQGGDDDY